MPWSLLASKFSLRDNAACQRIDSATYLIYKMADGKQTRLLLMKDTICHLTLNSCSRSFSLNMAGWFASQKSHNHIPDVSMAQQCSHTFREILPFRNSLTKIAQDYHFPALIVSLDFACRALSNLNYLYCLLRLFFFIILERIICWIK